MAQKRVRRSSLIADSEDEDGPQAVQAAAGFAEDDGVGLDQKVWQQHSEDMQATIGAETADKAGPSAPEGPRAQKRARRSSRLIADSQDEDGPQAGQQAAGSGGNGNVEMDVEEEKQQGEDAQAAVRARPADGAGPAAGHAVDDTICEVGLRLLLR